MEEEPQNNKLGDTIEKLNISIKNKNIESALEAFKLIKQNNYSVFIEKTNNFNKNDYNSFILENNDENMPENNDES